MDEAYSLVKDRRDTFGLEAVDTLIKEMEDHRGKVIVTRQAEPESLPSPGAKVSSTYDYAFKNSKRESVYYVDLHEGVLIITGDPLERMVARQAKAAAHLRRLRRF